jgi:hypothetical protein
MLTCAPTKKDLPQRILLREYGKSIKEIDMIGNIARWGTNTLLIGMAITTYAVFVLAK